MKSRYSMTVLSALGILIGLGGARPAHAQNQDATCDPNCVVVCATLCGPNDKTHVKCVDGTDMLDEQGKSLNGTVVRVVALCPPNLQAATVLTRMDVDGNGIPDLARDTDGDGLPDNWELGGNETLDRDGDGRPDDRVVFFAAPTAIVPGTPPTPIFTRRQVATSALSADTDGDGLSDFIEVFGLMFIDENRNGRLDESEWADLNGDGLPSPGEWPRDNTGQTGPNGIVLLHDFDGFVFTDPTNPDTDGDGLLDGEDLDPLINPRSFGINANIIVRFDIQDDDIDNDGLGNGMDMGNDLVPADGAGVQQFQNIDNPQDLTRILDLFRKDLLSEGIVPESVIEDLLGADWNGDGLWRTTDVRLWTPVIDDPDTAGSTPPAEFVLDDGTELYARRDFADLAALYNSANFKVYGGRGIGLGWQEVLRPPSRDAFIPDLHIWAILYSWRVPGFDIDGDGFVGVPNSPSTAAISGGDIAVVALRRNTGGRFFLAQTVARSSTSNNDRPFDDRIGIAPDAPKQTNQLDGVIDTPGLADFLRSTGCGAFGLSSLAAMFVGLIGLRRTRR